MATQIVSLVSSAPQPPICATTIDQANTPLIGVVRIRPSPRRPIRAANAGRGIARRISRQGSPVAPAPLETSLEPLVHRTRARALELPALACSRMVLDPSRRLL